MREEDEAQLELEPGWCLSSQLWAGSSQRRGRRGEGEEKEAGFSGTVATPVSHKATKPCRATASVQDTSLKPISMVEGQPALRHNCQHLTHSREP